MLFIARLTTTPEVDCAELLIESLGLPPDHAAKAVEDGFACRPEETGSILGRITMFCREEREGSIVPALSVRCVYPGDAEADAPVVFVGRNTNENRLEQLLAGLPDGIREELMKAREEMKARREGASEGVLGLMDRGARYE